MGSPPVRQFARFIESCCRGLARFFSEFGPDLG